MSFIRFLLFLVFTAPLVFATDPVAIYQKVVTEDAILIDVRERDEVEQGMIKQARWMALSEMSEIAVLKLKKESEQKVVYVYCRSGQRSQKFINQLQTQGMRAINLGGFDELKKMGLPSTK